MPGTTRYTLKDVAQRAGVAISTASLVFSGKRPVAEATSQRVLKAAEELGYHGPDALASSLRQGRSGIVGVFAEGRLLNSFRDPFAVSVLDGLAQGLSRSGSGILLLPAQGDDAAVVERMSRIPLDAVTFPLGGHISRPVAEHLLRRRVPVIATGQDLPDEFVRLTFDDRAAMRDIALHLQSEGHEQVAVLELPNPETNPDARERTAGLLEVYPNAHVVTAGENSIAGGAVAAEAARTEAPEVTALVAHSDLLAVGAIQNLGAHGLATPTDVSVTGFDGIDLPWLVGSLTTVNQNGLAKGETVAELVRKALAGEAEDLVHPYEIVIGSSTAPPPQTTA